MSISNIIIIDDDPKYTQIYNRFIDNYQDFQIIQTFECVEHILALKKTLSVDIILADIDLTQYLNEKKLRKLKEIYPYSALMIFSKHKKGENIKKAFSYGARGYLTKPLTYERLLTALESVKRNRSVLSDDIIEKMIQMICLKKYDLFSERENEIVGHLSSGATYKHIAQTLFITTSAVNFHIQNIYMKLNVNSKSEALQKLNHLQSA